jgi:hypothetical protein
VRWREGGEGGGEVTSWGRGKSQRPRERERETGAGREIVASSIGGWTDDGWMVSLSLSLSLSLFLGLVCWWNVWDYMTKEPWAASAGKPFHGKVAAICNDVVEVLPVCSKAEEKRQ